MPSIRDVVQALGSREGVEAVILLSRDGLTIDAHARNGIDADSLAARVPPAVAACQQLGTAAERGGFGMGLVEYEHGLVLVAELTADALLAIFFGSTTNVGAHLYEFRRHRAAIAKLL